jgi:hypothetical protein
MPKETKRANLVPLPGGWALYQQRDVPQVVVISRFVPDDQGRLRIHEFQFKSRDPITPLLVREIRLGQLESIANHPSIKEMLLQSLEDDPAEMVLQHGGTDAPITFPLGPGRAHDQTLAKRQRPIGSLKLRVPRSRPYPDQFFIDVADKYGRAESFSIRPAAEIARANGVPIDRVHGWIKGARSRGFLGPGRRRRS